MKKVHVSRCRPPRASRTTTPIGVLVVVGLKFLVVSGFGIVQQPTQPSAWQRHTSATSISTATTRTSRHRMPPLLVDWSFGGTETMETIDSDAESCELAPVRIERTSANSRKILGEITAPVPLEDVWAILTDYDRLAIHVPNLMESRITERLSGGEQGDGQFRCRLFQRGAQKVFGFEFGASLTMDMNEVMVSGPAPLSTLSEESETSSSSSSSSNSGIGALGGGGERLITFKRYDSFFFSGFDGQWKVKELLGEDGNSVETKISYVVDVRPKGPVPVAALEWRIKQDVPTNLLSVRQAAINVGYEGVMATRQPPGARSLSSFDKDFEY